MTFWGNARISLLNFVLDNRFRTEGVQGTVLEVPVQGTCAVVQKDASTVCDQQQYSIVGYRQQRMTYGHIFRLPSMSYLLYSEYIVLVLKYKYLFPGTIVQVLGVSEYRHPCFLRSWLLPEQNLQPLFTLKMTTTLNWKLTTTTMMHTFVSIQLLVVDHTCTHMNTRRMSQPLVSQYVFPKFSQQSPCNRWRVCG